MQVELIIKQVRERKGISLRELEDLTGIDRQRLSNIENKKVELENISFIEMLVIAENLAVKITELFIVRHIEIQYIQAIKYQND